MALIKYNGETLTEIFEGQKVVLHTNGHDLDGDIEINGVGGGSAPDINGIIREYKVNAGANVSAGDFVEFVTKFGNGKFSSNVVSCVSACKLDNSRVLVAYRDGGNFSYGTAVILSIANGAVFVGTTTVFNGAGTDSISTCALTENKVLVTYRDGGNSYYGTAKVLTISGTTITAGTETVFDSNNTYYISAVALTESKVLVTYERILSSGTNTGRARVLTISGTTITVGAETVFNSNTSSYISAVALTESKVLVAYEHTNGSERAVVLTISGTTITVGTSVVFSSYNSRYLSAVALSESKVLVAHNARDGSAGTAYSRVRAVVLTISNTTITAGTTIGLMFEHNSNTDIEISTCALTENKALVAYRDLSNSSYGTVQVLTISDTTITAGSKAIFDYNTTSYVSLVAFSEAAAMVAYDNAFGSYSTLTIDGTTITADDSENATFVKPATSNLHNVGIAKTSGAEGEMIEVYCAV